MDTTTEARDRLADLLTPVLQRYGEPEAASALPASSPYSFEQILDQDWYPRNRHGLDDDD
jgi:hypothetical protein